MNFIKIELYKNELIKTGLINFKIINFELINFELIKNELIKNIPDPSICSLVYGVSNLNSKLLTLSQYKLYIII